MNLNRLENDLRNLVEQDKVYQQRNDAKIRAVEQRVPTYEHFEQLVAGSHLKPLGADDTIGGMTYQKWNTMAQQQSVDTKNLKQHETTPRSNDHSLLDIWK